MGLDKPNGAEHGQHDPRVRMDGRRRVCKGCVMKGQQKPKKLAKKAPHKSLKEQRAAKAAKKKSRG